MKNWTGVEVEGLINKLQTNPNRLSRKLGCERDTITRWLAGGNISQMYQVRLSHLEESYDKP